MERLIAQPYKLFNKIQNYDWGTKDNDAFIPKFLGIKPEHDVPYAELWIGAHPKAPSEIEIDGKRFPLDKIIAEYPLEFLGEYVSKKFDNKFPFLLKVLSAERALSIQTHPNKEQAIMLHAADPKNYPDDNHKPEIAIAVDSLTAIAGFRPVDEIIMNLHSLPEVQDFAGKDNVEKIFNSIEISEQEKSIKELYSVIMNKAKETEELQTCIKSIQQRLKNRKDLSLEESQFLTQFSLFGADVGLLSFFFFNFIQLKPQQAIFTKAGVPHAYIKGNIIECMANSDNVVRAGLSNKFKDVNTLLKIMRYDFEEYEIINREMKVDDVSYKTPAEEFEVSYSKKSSGYFEKIKSDNKPKVYLISNGNLKISWTTDGGIMSQKFSKGESFFIPAFLFDYEISVEDEAEFYRVEIS